MINEKIGKVSTGSFDFNDWLCGGYERGVVTMIVGAPGSGKTNFSILAACSQARDGKVVFIDTEGGFSVERVEQIVGRENLEKILSNIFILSPIDFSEQVDSFVKLKKFVSKGVSMIIVDSMVMLYRLEIGGENEEKISNVNKEMSLQMKDLVSIARKKDIPVLITNQVWGNFLSFEDVRKGIERKTNIVGGDVFKYWSKCIIELKHNSSRSAVLLKHRSLSRKDFNFEIRSEGIFKKKGFRIMDF